MNQHFVMLTPNDFPRWCCATMIFHAQQGGDNVCWLKSQPRNIIETSHCNHGWLRIPDISHGIPSWHRHLWCPLHMGASKNRGTPKSSILIGFSIINHPFWGTTILGNPIWKICSHLLHLNFNPYPHLWSWTLMDFGSALFPQKKVSP